jgi:1-aminocyclopropane-1-carboxylate deaminase/D-cysteine desulfhydrase-like pyridoxal-dependent ACC family enzyme
MQSNHARVTAATGAVLGLHVILVLNGTAAAAPTANARLDQLFGADVRLVATREERAPAMERAADDARTEGRKPFIVPLGASTPTGAIGFARGVQEIVTAGLKPSVIVHASSSAGTQAGLIAGTALFGMRPRVIGVSADESETALAAAVGTLLGAMAERLGAKPETIGADREIDDRQVGGGYGVPTDASIEALELVAQSEGILLDPVYTAKAMAGLIARVRAGAFSADDTVLFWHTGGQVGFFA